LIYNGSGNAYAKLATPDGSGAGSFTLSGATGLTDGTYTLNIYGEEANGNLYSDFASNPVSFDADVKSGAITYLTLLTPDVPFNLDGGELGLKDGKDYISTWTLGTNNGILSVKGSESAKISAQITGAGGLTKTGSGVLTLTGDNGYTGGTTIEGGFINFNSADNFETTGQITLNGGGLQWAAGTATDISGRLAPLARAAAPSIRTVTT
jgi:autotransporter-associated beta strand protein